MEWKYKIAFILIGYFALTALTNLNAPSIMYVAPLSSYHSSPETINLRVADGVNIVANYYSLRNADTKNTVFRWVNLV